VQHGPAQDLLEYPGPPDRDLGGARQSAAPRGVCAIGNDGRYVAYTSYATNLVPGDTNGVGDIFRWDSLTGQTDRWSVATDGSQALLGTGSGQPAITNAGGAIAFVGTAQNLTPGDGFLTQDVFLRHP
jgi:TolB protein